MAKSRNPDRLLVRDGFKHYRRRYSLTEVRWGFAVLLVLVGIGVWVKWMGDNPDPALFAAPIPTAKTVAPSKAADRGPVPEGLAPPNWSEGDISQFDADTLYVKINGRAYYFLSKGFESLYFVPLVFDDDEAITVDIEVYDLGTAPNALGTFAGERREEDDAEASEGGMRFMARNALFLARSRFYIRALGADESDVTKAALAHIEGVFVGGIEGESRPWAYQLFAGDLGIPEGSISFAKENAFSFGFAKEVYIARTEDDSELFVVLLDNAESASALAQQFVEGFASYGTDRGDGWTEDEFIQTVATARSQGEYVYGVRGAQVLTLGQAHLESLSKALAERRDKAAPAAVESEMPSDSAQDNTEETF